MREQGAKIPEAIEAALSTDLFVPEDFEALVLDAASEIAFLGKLLRELQEPRPGGQDCIPWLGETMMKERILRMCARGKIAINLRGMEYLQTQTGEDEDAAWRRLKPKLSFTGRQLDEIRLLQPSAVPSTGGATPPDPISPAGGLFGGGSVNPAADTGTNSDPESGSTDTDQAPEGGIFGGSASGAAVTLSNPATSPLNLIGKLESWGVGPATPVKEITLKLDAATGAQIKELLRKLPDGLTYELSLNKEDG